MHAGVQEADELFDFLRRFVDQGNAVIFISHKLAEVIKLSHRVTVIRDGKVINVLEGGSLSQSFGVRPISKRRRWTAH